MKLTHAAFCLVLLPSPVLAFCTSIPKTTASTAEQARSAARQGLLDPWANQRVLPVTCEDRGATWQCFTDRATCEAPMVAPPVLHRQYAPAPEGYYRDVPSGREYRCDNLYGCRPSHE